MKFLGKITLVVLSVLLLGTSYRADGAAKKLTVAGDHGNLSAVMQTPDHASKYPMVMILHGFTASKDMTLLTDLADALEQKGIASVRFDFNGHGESEGAFQDMTVPNEIEDARHVYNYVSAMPDVTSVSIAGHSQGGVVAGMLAGELGAAKVKSIALMAPAAVLRDSARRGSMMGVHIDPDNVPETIDFNGITIGRNYILTARDLPIYETTGQYKGPAIIVQGGRDMIVPTMYAERYRDVLKNSTLIVHETMDHAFTGDETEVAGEVADFFAKEVQK